MSIAGSVLLYAGFFAVMAGLVAALRRRIRRRALFAAATGLLMMVAAILMPATTHRSSSPATRLDHFLPEWQFREQHALHIDAPPARVYEALKEVRANEIAFFRTLTWIRRGGRRTGESILDPGSERPLLDVATKSGFTWLADTPEEIVVGTIIRVPPGTRPDVNPGVFESALPPGSTLAAMNFAIEPDSRGGSLLTTETRVFANDDASRRAFAAYWCAIYPGSALIRRMWLRAVARRAEAARS